MALSVRAAFKKNTFRKSATAKKIFENNMIGSKN
jgi:hypothetical protein